MVKAIRRDVPADHDGAAPSFVVRRVLRRRVPRDQHTVADAVPVRRIGGRRYPLVVVVVFVFVRFIIFRAIFNVLVVVAVSVSEEMLVELAGVELGDRAVATLGGLLDLVHDVGESHLPERFRGALNATVQIFLLLGTGLLLGRRLVHLHSVVEVRPFISFLAVYDVDELDVLDVAALDVDVPFIHVPGRNLLPFLHATLGAEGFDLVEPERRFILAHLVQDALVPDLFGGDDADLGPDEFGRKWRHAAPGPSARAGAGLTDDPELRQTRKHEFFERTRRRLGVHRR